MRSGKIAALCGALAFVSAPAFAGPITLTFEGVGDEASVNDFYNGGTDSLGNSGTNYGVSFSSTSLALIDADAGGNGNFANEPSPNTILFFLDSSSATLNYAAGFTTGFSFFYTSSTDATVNVWSGLNATGTLLGQITVSAQYNVGCTGDPSGSFCNWTAAGVSFSGTAMSIDFGGTADQTGYDNITFGSATPGTTGGVPEPASWALMLSGFGLVGGSLRYRTRKVRFARTFVPSRSKARRAYRLASLYDLTVGLTLRMCCAA